MIALTDTATAKVKELIEAEGQPELFLRVAVRPGGCSGLSYEMFFDTERADDDIEQRVRRRHGRRRPRQRPAPRRRVARLQGRPPGRRVHDQEPERAAHLRLRPVVLLDPFRNRLATPLRGPLRPSPRVPRRSRTVRHCDASVVEHARVISSWPNAPSRRAVIVPVASMPKSHGSLGRSHAVTVGDVSLVRRSL